MTWFLLCCQKKKTTLKVDLEIYKTNIFEVFHILSVKIHTYNTLLKRSCRLDSWDSGGSRLVVAAIVSVSQPSARASEDKDQRITGVYFLHSFTLKGRLLEQIYSMQLCHWCYMSHVTMWHILSQTRVVIKLNRRCKNSTNELFTRHRGGCSGKKKQTFNLWKTSQMLDNEWITQTQKTT